MQQQNCQESEFLRFLEVGGVIASGSPPETRLRSVRSGSWPLAAAAAESLPSCSSTNRCIPAMIALTENLKHVFFKISSYDLLNGQSCRYLYFFHVYFLNIIRTLADTEKKQYCQACFSNAFNQTFSRLFIGITAVLTFAMFFKK